MFWVLTAGGVLDLFAYNHDDYTVWTREIAKVADSNAQVGNIGQSLRGQERIRDSGMGTRPASSHSQRSRTRVAPATVNRSTSPPVNKTGPSLSTEATAGLTDSKSRCGGVPRAAHLFLSGPSRRELTGSVSAEGKDTPWHQMSGNTVNMFVTCSDVQGNTAETLDDVI